MSQGIALFLLVLVALAIAGIAVQVLNKRHDSKTQV